MRIFKYLHPDRIDVLEACRICVSSPLNLNDPFELKPPLRLFGSDELMLNEAMKFLPEMAAESYDKMPSEVQVLFSRDQFLEIIQTLLLSKEGGLSDTINKLMPEIAKRFNTTTEQRMGILCLSETHDNLLMWAHYGCSHEGFVIEFDSEAAFFNQKRSEVDELRSLRPVIYSPIRPTLTFSEAKDMSALLTKSDHWSYEREWRMMLDLNDASAVISVGDKRFHLFDFHPQTIKSVIFGSRMSQAKKDEISKLITERSSLEHINCFQAEVDDTFFKLNIFSAKPTIS
ncbi:DUF2971 domain-containing protein [Pseudomonas fluorescens]|uniref:DUF2971 domain-containing protein n=1 Tax=Pseudomonas fluorescens TaxID=294 RepID=UPI003C2AA35C